MRPYQKHDRDACLALLAANTPAHFAPGEQADFAAYLDATPEHFQVVGLPHAASGQTGCLPRSGSEAGERSEPEGGTVIACGGIEAFPARGEAEFRWVMVSPAAQGRGLGRQLMLESARYLHGHTPIRRILVYTTPGSAGFFRRLGFPGETLRIEPDYWTQGLHLELLALRLE